jgi:protease-4
MSEAHYPSSVAGPGQESAPAVIPVRYPLPYPPPPPRRSLLGTILGTLLVLSIPVVLGGVLLFVLMQAGLFSVGDSGSIYERHYAGSRNAPERIAIVRIDGVLMEGMNEYAKKQLERAARDSTVKAVVLRINSPGGSITASDDLHRRIVELRDGKTISQQGGPKPIVVSMGSIAASGGYYIAAPAQYIVAERSTITGSIGVYAAFPNFAELAERYGFRMNLINAGDMKDAGSMFHPMTAQERQLWQDMVDHAYHQFLEVVEQGRPALEGKMREIVVDREIPDRDRNGNIPLDADGKEKMVRFIRRRADGGIFTADEARQFGLIDEIGYLDAAIAQARKLASLSEDCGVITYDRPVGLLEALTGAQARQSAPWSAEKLSSAATPRLWYLAPGCELAGVFAAAGE